MRWLLALALAALPVLASAQTGDPNLYPWLPKRGGAMTGALRFAGFANSSEPATCDAGRAGSVVYSTTDNVLRVCNGTTWVSVASAASAITGSLTAGRVPYASGATTLVDAAGFSFAGSVLTVPNILDSGLTASRVVATDGSKNLVSTIASADLLASISDPTGTGVAVFGTSPSITTSLTTGSTTFSLVNTNATTVNFAGAATTLNVGAASATIGLGSGSLLSWAAGDVTITHSAGTLTLGGGNIQLADNTLILNSSGSGLSHVSGGSLSLVAASHGGNGNITIEAINGGGIYFNFGTTGDAHFNNGGGASYFYTAPRPSVNDGAALGTSTLGWSDAYFANGAVLTFGAPSTPDVTITHSADTLAFAGASSGYTFDARVASSRYDLAISPTLPASAANVAVLSGGDNATYSGQLLIGDGASWQFRIGRRSGSSTTDLFYFVDTGIFQPAANDGAALGTPTASFSDLYLASGGVINWNNGATALTQDVGVGHLSLTGLPFNVAVSGASGGFYTAYRTGSWDVLGYIDDGSANKVAVGGFRGSQWVATVLYASGSEVARFTTTSVQVGNNVLIARDTNAGLTASTTQTQGQGALTAEINEVATCVNPNDTVTLPAAAAGYCVVVINNGASTLQIFPASGDNLGAGVDTAATLASGSNRRYCAYDGTNWEAI